MNIRLITEEDIPKWEKLSYEHDCYVKEFYSGFSEWSIDNNQYLTYKKHLEAKVRQKEAYMAVDISDNCLGVIAFSKKRNCIAFFGISQNSNVQTIGDMLLSHTIQLLETDKNIYTKLIACNLDLINQYRILFKNNGFRETGILYKRGLAFITFVKKPPITSKSSGFNVTSKRCLACNSLS